MAICDIVDNNRLLDWLAGATHQSVHVKSCLVTSYSIGRALASSSLYVFISVALLTTSAINRS